MKQHKMPLALAMSSLTLVTHLPSPASAETIPAPPPVTVSATRTERPVDDVPNTVTVTPASAIERSGARDLKELFRHEIDVTVRATPARHTAAGDSGRAGNESINIRGLEGINQALAGFDRLWLLQQGHLRADLHSGHAAVPHLEALPGIALHRVEDVGGSLAVVPRHALLAR